VCHQKFHTIGHLIFRCEENKINCFSEPLTNFGGKTEELCWQIISWQKLIYTFESDYNKNLIEMDARPIKPENVSDWASFFHENEK